MKVLWITSHADTLNSIRPEAETLIGLAKRGVECEIMTQGDSAYRGAMEAAGVRVIDFVPKRKFGWRETAFIRRHLVQGRHDILHLFNNKAIATGVRAARADWILTLDGDGQNDPADIPALVERLRAQPNDEPPLQLIMGHRAKRQDSWLRKFSSRVANGVRSRLLHDATPDSGCGLKLFSRQAFLELPYFDHMHRFLPALFQRNGGAVISVRVNHRPRTRGVSKYGLHNRLWVGITDLFGVSWLLRRAKLPEVSELGADGQPRA